MLSKKIVDFYATCWTVRANTLIFIDTIHLSLLNLFVEIIPDSTEKRALDTENSGSCWSNFLHSKV